MRSILIVVLLVVAGVSLGVVAAYGYDIKTKNNQTQAAEQRAQAESREAARKADVEGLLAACQKGQNIYDTELTAAQKGKVQRPICDASSN